MHLKTTETHASLALAAVPPGNILRDLARIRGKLFTLNSLEGSRAWFDFPVLAWLSRCPDGGLLASLASSFAHPLEFKAIRWEGNFLAMPIPADFNHAILPRLASYILEPETHVLGAAVGAMPTSGSEKWCYGPFPSGKGMICAVVNKDTAGGNAPGTGLAEITAEANRLAGKLPRSNVYSLALVELHWYPGPNYGSSWAILSSVVAGRLHSVRRSMPVKGHTA